MIRLTITLSGGNIPRLTTEQESHLRHDAALSATICVRENFVRLAARSNSRSFWHDAAAGTRLAAHEEGGKAVIEVKKRGVRLQLKGGTVRASGRPSAFTGKPTRSILVPFPDSPLAQRRAGLHELGIPQERVFVLKSKQGTPILVAAEQLKTRSKLIYLGKLVRATHHKPHPDVLPGTEEMRAAAIHGAQQHLKGLFAR